MDPNCNELKRLEKKHEALNSVIAKHETRLSNLQSSAFSLANYYFVFQGVILTIICNDAKNLKPSDRWFLFTISILAVSINLIALIRTGIKYIETKGSLDIFIYKRNDVHGEIAKIEESYKDQNDSGKPAGCEERERKRYLYLAACIILFLGFAAVVLVGCWKFLGDQNEG